MTGAQFTNSWISLAIAIIFGVLGTISLKLSQGFTNRKYVFVIALYYAISFIAMTYAIHHIELSTVYAIWSGVGTFLVSIVGMYHFKEPFSYKKMLFLSLIVIGVCGIHFNAIT